MISHLLFLILFIRVLFFSWWIWLKVCQFCLSFQRIQFCFFLLVSMSFNSALILIISFLLLTLGFVCCSSSSFRYRIRLVFFEIFLSSLGRLVLLYTFLSGLPKKETFQINNLTLHLKQLEEKQQTKPRANRRKKIIKIGAELNDIETKKKKIQWTQDLIL